MRYEYEFHRFVLPMFLHADIGHFLANAIAGIMIGSNIEPDIGPLNFAALYFISG